MSEPRTKKKKPNKISPIATRLDFQIHIFILIFKIVFFFFVLV